MTPRFTLATKLPADVELVGVPVCSDLLRRTPTSHELDWDYLAQRGFDARPGTAQSLPGTDGRQLVALGAGPSDDVGPKVMRRLGATLARFGRRQEVVATSALDLLPEEQRRPTPKAAAAQALAEGAALAVYQYSAFKSEPARSRTEQVVVLGSGGKRVQAGLDLGAAVADAVALARDLVNEPGGSLTARRLAQVAVEVAEREDLQVTVMDGDDIAEARLGGLLGVNQGSEQPPRFIELCWNPPGRSRGTVALVGKGITFDSGGLNLKAADGMVTMKDDMAGGAAVIAAFSALRAVNPPVRVLGYVPATDNMGGGDATRPGDVLRIRNGRTVEVLNTDAEGRLVLADALSLAAEAQPDAIIDLATLTGSCQVALGTRIAGLMANDDAWRDQVAAAAERTDEAVWALPLPDEYRRQLDSDVADLRNIGTSRYGGTLVAGLFLREFVPGGIPWAHLDICGPAWTDVADNLGPKGGTGFGVRLLLDLLANFTRPA